MLTLPISRREFLGISAAGTVASSTWLSSLASAAGPQRPPKACILLWMPGGPTQTDTFDMKPGTPNGGEFKPIETTVPGISFCEHFPQLAKQAQELAVVRSMSTKEGDHARATHLLRTGSLPQGPIQYPAIGSLLSKELGREDAELPNCVSIMPNTFLSAASFGPGFLGPRYAPLVVGPAAVASADYRQILKVDNLTGPPKDVLDARLKLLDGLDRTFAGSRPGVVTESHLVAYRSAVRMMRSEAVKAFDLEGEPDALRDAYGRNAFGQGCLLARRLVERGVPFIEIALNGASQDQAIGWDTHQNNFAAVKQLLGVLDPAWGTLLADLRDRGLLDSTMVVWMGEFGRTPKINNTAGRDHFPAAWSTVLAGGGLKTGQVIGKSSDDGMTVTDRPVAVADLLATVVTGLGLDPTSQNLSNVGRPIPLVESTAKPITEVL